MLSANNCLVLTHGGEEVGTALGVNYKEDLDKLKGSCHQLNLFISTLNHFFVGAFIHPNHQRNPFVFKITNELMENPTYIASVWLSDHYFKYYLDDDLAIIENIRWEGIIK